VIRLGVLASGGGTNLQSLLDACAAGRIDGRVAVVISNVPGAGVPAVVLASKGVADRTAYDAGLVEALRAQGVDLVCLAGYMRLVTPAFLSAFGPSPATRGCPRVLNVHPGLLPSFPGLHAAGQAIRYGARISGCTVHFVDEGTDTGPIVVQAAVPVVPGEEEAALVARIQALEHRLYPQAVQWLAQGRLSLEGRQVRRDGAAPPPAPPLVWPPLDG